MPQERTEAIVLRGVDFSETSRVVTFLSPHRGRMACLAAGAKRAKAGMAASLDTFNRVELVYYWKDSRTMQKLGEVALIDGYPGIKNDLAKAVYGALPLELAYKIAHENEPSPPLYATMVTGLESFAKWSAGPDVHATWQGLQLLSAAGFAPALDHCARCGRKVDTPTGFAFDGGATCSNCPTDRRLTPTGFAALLALSGSREFCPPLEQTGDIFELFCGFAARQLDSDLRSVRVIRQIYGQ
ncbi:MAG: DNA repair protein RecO [Candidatus Hydrogenedentes bacterium]|nr:DNA repair protein RecO [Candidatus Hydrogenedentota bacterium]